MSFPVPLESDEQIVLVQWLELVGLRFSHIPNSTWTSSPRQKVQNHRMGVRRGTPDMIIVMPSTRTKDGKGRLLFIELKRRTGGRLSSEQQDWIDALNALGVDQVEALVCPGAEPAIAAVNQYLKPRPATGPF